MTSPVLQLTTTDLVPGNLFDIEGKLIPDMLRIDQAMSGMGTLGNILVNASFEIDQRNSGPYAGNGVYGFDRWKNSYVGAVTLTVSAEAATVDTFSLYSAKCVFVRGAGTSATLEQLVEMWPVLKGQTLTWSARVKCSAANAVRLRADDGITSSVSPYHSGGGGWETLTTTHLVDGLATTFKAEVQFTSDCTAYVDNGVLGYGSVQLPYVPAAQGDDLVRCQRYYEMHGGQGGHPSIQGYATAGGQLWMAGFTFATVKGAAPAGTVSGSWSLTNCTGPTMVSANRYGYTLGITSVAAGIMSATPNSGLVTAEWNPS